VEGMGDWGGVAAEVGAVGVQKDLGKKKTKLVQFMCANCDDVGSRKLNLFAGWRVMKFASDICHSRAALSTGGLSPITAPHFLGSSTVGFSRWK
jgi:hypothetical protein